MCFLAYVAPQRLCKYCDIAQPWDSFSTDKYMSDGMNSRCRSCYSLKQKREYAKDPAKHAAKARQRRVTHAALISQQRRIRYAANRDRLLARKRMQYWQDPDKMRARNRTHRAKHHHQRLLDGRAAYAAHPEMWVAWRAKNLDVVRLIAARRRARKRALSDTFTIAERDFMVQYWQHACAVCGNQEGFFWTLADDHWIPVSSPDCPGTVAHNIVPLCHGSGGCNNAKRNRDALTWLTAQYGARRAGVIMQRIGAYFAVVRARQSHVS